MDLDPEDQDLYSSEEGILNLGFHRMIHCSLLCLFTRMVCTWSLAIIAAVYFYCALSIYGDEIMVQYLALSVYGDEIVVPCLFILSLKKLMAWYFVGDFYLNVCYAYFSS